jgi:P4 family phage/plasmid primase-like protien
MTKRHLSAVPDAPQPYAFSARAYFNAGWSPLPLPPGQKSYPPTGYTGGKGRHAEPEKVEQWIRTKGDGNVALRMPPTLIGIDVDAYSGKDGAATLAAAEESWGELPATWRSTSREDAISGIRLFRIPEGLAWPGQLPFGGGVELCRWDHRYVIVAPSIHDATGRQYQWFAPDGTQTTSAASEGGEWEFPALEELPELPAEWVAGLTSGKKWEGHSEADLDPEEVAQWILDRPGGALCQKMQRTLDLWMAKISGGGEDGGAHDFARDGAWAVLRDAAAGHSGVQAALRKIMLAHKEALRTRSPERFAKAAGEWASIKARGVRKVAAEGATDDDDPCVMGEVSRPAAKRNRGSEGMDFERDDIGNGQRFSLKWRDEVRWVPAYDSWYIWSGNVWGPDLDGEIHRMATLTVREMRGEAEFIEDPKIKTSFLKFVSSSSNEARINAMLRMSRTNKGMTRPAEQFNQNRSQLVCANGTLVLPMEFSGEPVKRIPSVQEHYNTISTGTEYRSDARMPEWEKFLDRFQPDPEIRNWLQKLAGYSLLGSNPRRLMVACIGDTSTGKTTFAEAVAASLGEYAGSANMTIFRDNQDDKARPDLLRVLPMRFVYAEEASRSWHLHPDQIKRITGGAPMTARGMRSNLYVDMVPAFTPWLVTNHAPTIEGADAALWRRLVVVPFDVQIPKTEEDARFRDRLASPEGRASILAWLAEGYRAYLADPDSLQEIPVGAAPANAKFRAEVSDLATFLNEVCEVGERDDVVYRVTPFDLYQAYQSWCSSSGVQQRDVMSLTKFGREINGEHPKKGYKEDGKPRWYRQGIRLKSDWSRIVTGH